MNKKLLGLIGVLVVIALGVFAIFFLNGDEEDLAEVEDTPTEEVNEDTNKVDENEVKDDEVEGKDQYEELLDEAIGDERLTEEEMIKIGQELVTRYYVSIEITDVEELEELLRDTLIEESFIQEVLSYGVNTEGITDVKVEFNDDTVLQVSNTEFEYSTFVKVEDNIVDEHLASILAMIEKEDGMFKLRSLNITNINNDE